MNIAWMMPILGVIALSLLIMNARKTKLRWQQTKRILAHVKEIKLIISLLQKHRGKCAAHIQGDIHAKKLMMEIQVMLKPLIAELNSVPVITTQDRWVGFTDHWKRLASSAENLPLENSYLQHTEMISNLLYLLEDIAEHEHFNKNNFESFPNISLLWRELPFTVEYIGQSRAMGVAIAAAGISTRVDKVKLGYLEKKITQLSSMVFQQFKNNGAHTSEQSQLIMHAYDECKKLTSVIKSEFLNQTEVKMTSETYFTIASESMDAINRLLDYELKQVEKYLDTM